MHKYYSMTYLNKKEKNKIKAKYIEVDAIVNNKCFRCGNEVDGFSCQNCTEFGVLTKNDKLYNLDEKHYNPDYIKVKQELMFTKLQQECANEMIKAYHNYESMLIWAVCGAGKTEITFPVIEQVLYDGGNICFAIPRIDILYDVYDRLSDYFVNVSIKILNSQEEKYTDAQIYVMTTNQILKFKNCFSICIVDEVDAYPYEHNIKYDYGIKSSLIKKGSIFYLTSTPSEVMISKKLKQFVINRRWHGYDLPVPKLSYLNLELIKYSIKLRLIIYKNKRQQLWFVSNINMAIKIKEIYNKYNLVIDVVYASDEKRRKKILDFKDKKIDILITTTILERGVTFDDIDVYVIDSSNKMYNKAALVQIAGRVNRKKEYQNGKVIFFHQGLTNIIEESILEIKQMNSYY